MLLKRKEVAIQDHDRSKNQGEVRSNKEMEYNVDISEVNMFHYAFYKRFEVEEMSAQFVQLF